MLIGYDASRAFLKEKTGTETYSYQLLKALLELGSPHRFRVYTCPRGPDYQFPILNSQTNDKFQTPPQYHSVLGRNSKGEAVPVNWSRFWTQGGLAWETWKNPPDALFIPAHVIPFLRNPKVPTVVTVHDLGLEYLSRLPRKASLRGVAGGSHYSSWKEKLYLGWMMERLRARLATHIIAVSEATKRDVIEKLRVPEDKVSVVYEGVSEKFKVKSFCNATRRVAGGSYPSATVRPRCAGGETWGRGREKSKAKIEEIKREYEIKGEYILFVGTVQPRKNLIRLIKAFSVIMGAGEEKGPAFKGHLELNSGESSVLQLVIAGKPGWNCTEIFAAPQKFGVGDRVRFLNYVPAEDLPYLYAGAKMLCLPSLHEGFGLPVLEAMSMGTPVVASRCSSLLEVGGAAAVYVDPIDVNDIARGLEKVLSWDRETRLNQIEAGRKWSLRFTWERAAKETLAVLEQAASQH